MDVKVEDAKVALHEGQVLRLENEERETESERERERVVKRE